MKTLRLSVDPAHLDTPEARQTLETAAAILRSGGLVAFPTETVYGLGANALNPEAVAKIFAAKQRPAWDPVIAHIADRSMLDGLVDSVPAAAEKLMAAHWPGPLTLLLPRSAAVPDAVTAGRPLVGVRMPAHPVALALIRAAGLPIAAPSANLFGHISPTDAAHVLDDLDGRIDAVLDAGPAEHGVESTVLDPAQSPIVVYRPGAVTLEQIVRSAGPAEIYRKPGELLETPVEAMPSPGVGIRHYAPRARLILLGDSLENLVDDLRRSLVQLKGEQIGVMLPQELEAPEGVHAIYRWGRWSAPAELASRLYAGLRRLDRQGCTVILCPTPPQGGIGAAILDRLSKAAR